jgi:hypothetical protein
MQINDEYLKHYLLKDIQEAMLPYMLNREVCVMAPKWCHKEGTFQKGQRNLKVHQTYMIEKIHKFKAEMGADPMQWYASLATYATGLPFKNFLIPKDQKMNWTINHWRSMIAYDFVIDLDCPQERYKSLLEHDTHAIAQKVYAMFGYAQIRNSSAHGFHIVVPYEYLSDELKACSFDPYNDNNIYSKLKTIATYFYKEYSELVDLSIYDSRRVIKVPYSLAVYPDKNVMVEIIKVLK